MGVKILQQCWKTYKVYSEKKNRKVHAARNVPSLNPNSHQSARVEPNEVETVVDNPLLRQSALDLTTYQPRPHRLRAEQTDRSQFLKDSSIVTKSNINKDQDLMLETENLATYTDKDQTLSNIRAPANISEQLGNLASLPRSDLANEYRNGLNERRTLQYSNGNRRKRTNRNNDR